MAVISPGAYIASLGTWSKIPADYRQQHASSCGLACLSAVSTAFGRPIAEEDVLQIAMGRKATPIESLTGVGIQKPAIFQFLKHQRIGHRVIDNVRVDLDAVLDTGRAALMLFEQYRCEYIDRGVIRTVRMAVGSESYHAVVVVGRILDNYLLFDPGWVKGGWQFMSTAVMDRALADAKTCLIGLDQDDGIDRKVRDDGVLLVNRNTGRWEFHDGATAETMGTIDIDDLSTYEETYSTIGEEIAPYQYIINVTNRCSLACKYCYAESPAPKELVQDMSVEVFRSIWQMADRINGDRESTIVLHGGEPMLMFDTLVDEMYAARAHNPNIQFSLQSNGLGLTEARMEAIKELGISVGISLDGPEDLNNAQRGNYKGTMRGVNVLRAAGMKVPILITLTKSICAEIERVIDHFVENKLYNLAFSPMIASGIGKKHADLAPTGEEYGSALTRAWKRLLHHRDNGEPVQIRELSRYIMHLSSNIRPALCGRTSCGAGKALLGVDVDGSIYACDMFMGHDEMILGNVQDFDLSLVEEHLNTHELFVNDRVETNSSCQTCRWEKVCSRGCPANNFLTDNIGEKSLFCDAFDEIHEELAISLATDEKAQTYLTDVALKDLLSAQVLRRDER